MFMKTTRAPTQKAPYNRIASRFLGRNRRLLFLLVVVILFGIVFFQREESTGATLITSLPLSPSTKNAKRIQTNPRILYYNRHSACTNNLQYVTSRLGLNFTQLRPGFLGDLGMREGRANDIANDGFVSAICNGFDVIIIGDTLPDARPFLQSLLRKNPSERCKSNIVIELTNRFDWGVADFDEYHQLIWTLFQASPPNLFWVANNAFEAKVMADDCNANPEFRILRPSGFSDVPAQEVSAANANTALIRELDKSEVLGTMTWMKMPFTRVVGHYGGPKTLKKYKAYIEFPYQVSTMKLYENLAEGVLMLIPSHEFFMELIEKRIHAFGPWEMLRRMGSEWYKYMDYYAPEISPYVYYFDSWDHLKQILEKTGAELDRGKQVRVKAPIAYKKIVDEMLHGWADLFGEMGFSVQVDGKPKPKSIPEIKKFRIPARYPQPKTVTEWKKTYERIKSWKSFERDEQMKIWDQNEKELTGMAKKVKEMAKVGNILEQLKVEGIKKLSVDQYRVLDFMNGETTGSVDAFGGSLQDLKTFDAAKEIIRLLKKFEAETEMAFKQSDFLVFGYHARNLRIFHALTVESPPKLEELKGDETQKLLTQAVDVLTKNLYPWLPSPGIQDLSDLTASFKTKRGIVFTFPTSGYPRGVHLILTLRNILNCTLPIEIFYNGDSDLSADKRQQLANLPGSITLVNTEERLPRVRDVNGYSIKPFVILASSFQEVIFLDDDVTLFQNPDTFLENSELWKTYGSIFFLDRSFSRGNSEWVRTFLTVPSLVANTGRYMTNVSRDEQESSFVALDKGKVSILHSLLSACHMNLKEARDDALQKYTHGDKESFWIAHEMLRVPYKFVPGIGGAAGFFRTKNGIQEPEVICGPQSHIDEKGRLIHFNGLVLSHKDDFTRGYIDFHHFAAPIKNNPGNIDIGYHPWCVHTREPEKEVHEFNAYEKETIGKIIELHKKLVVSDFKAPASG